MPSSWPQPAVLENLLNADNLGTKNGGKTATTPTDGDDAPSSPLYDHRVLALYKFVSPKIPKESLPALKAELETICRQHLARGTFLIAEEGINGTICYPFRHKAAAATAISTATTAVVDEDSLATVTQESIVERKEDGDELLSLLQAKFDGSLRIRISPADRPVFARLKIKIKSEIVTMHWQGDKQNSKNSDGGAEETTAPCSTRSQDDKNGNDKTTNICSGSSCVPCRPSERNGEYVKPRDWNKLLLDPETLVIDTRNEYEIDIGTFRNAVNPHTQSFIEFPDWMKQNLVDGNGNDTVDEKDGNVNSNSSNKMDDASAKKRKIAMFCTGGIRCEKATNAAMQLIPKDVSVYHLEGGILAYLDEVSEKESLFDGDCYVFDQRVAVTYENLPSTNFRQKCHGCRHPLSNKDLERDDYHHGISCRYCADKLTDQQKSRFAQRQHQMELALKEGRQHIYDPKEEAPTENEKKKSRQR
uniref:Rhodanese domain-containing protein n=2 Tax=Pseudo-nitzschia australis TaxID=44445 RepID=A0A7S4AK43_9STRA